MIASTESRKLYCKNKIQKQRDYRNIPVGSGTVRSGAGALGGRAPEEEFELRSTRAVRSTDRGSEVDEVTWGEVGCLEHRELAGDDVVNTTVGVCKDRYVSSH